MVFVLLSISLAEASVAALNISWQFSTSNFRPSSIATITVTAANTGVELTNAMINATPGPYVKILSGGQTVLGPIAVAESSQTPISIKIDENAPSTSSYVYLDVSYYTGSSNYQKTIYIPVTIVRSPEIQIANVNFSGKIEVGKTIDMTFDLKNVGMGDSKDLTLSLGRNSNFIVPESSGEIFISTLAKSESKSITIPLTVSPGSSIGTSTIPINLYYYDETRSNVFNETKEIGVLITGVYNFIVTPESQDVLAKGTSGTLTVKIANAGDQAAKFIILKSAASSNFDISPTTIYIGNMNSDDYDSEKLLLKVGSIEPGTYPVSFQISYKDLFGNGYNEVFSVNVKISSEAEYSSSNATQSPLPILVALIIVAIVFIVLYKKGYLNRLFKKK
ncbi:MAG: hypothetical protein V1678_00310 [Candidatus Aenigmatarchaeota archaeon]